MDLPTLDFSHFLTGNPTQQIRLANDLVASFKKHGFVKLINHGISEERIQELFSWSRRFFSMPFEAKNAITNVPSNAPQRGWSCLGAETTAKLRKENLNGGNGQDLTDEKEHFDAGPSDDAQYPNKWPDRDSLPGFKDFIESCYADCQQVCILIMEAMELGLQLPAGYMVQRCIPAASELRMNHYPPVTLEKLRQGKTKRGWPHSDFGIITLLFQDGVGGLELEDRAHPGTYVPVHPAPLGGPSEMVINISDTFQRWSNKAVPVGLHQVTTPVYMKNLDDGVVSERYSNVFFFKASRDTSVGPLPAFVTKESPAEYEEMSALELHKQMTTVLY